MSTFKSVRTLKAAKPNRKPVIEMKDGLFMSFTDPKTGLRTIVLPENLQSDLPVEKALRSYANKKILEIERAERGERERTRTNESFAIDHETDSSDSSFCDATGADKKKINQLTLSEVFQRQSKQLYEKACADLKIVPCQQFINQLCSSNFTVLDLRCLSLGVKGLRAICICLTSVTSLQSLNLTRNALGDEGVANLVQTLRESMLNLKHLNLSINGITAGGVEHLMSALLVPRKAHIEPPRSQCFYQQKAKKVIQLDDERIKLLTLDLSKNKIDDKAAIDIKRLIKTSKTLEQLDLSYNELSGEGARLLSFGIATNTSLTSLNLKWNSIRGEGALAFIQALRPNKKLKHLNLSWNGLSNEGAGTIGTILVTNKSLKSLNLASNRISSDGIAGLVSGLSANKALIELDLSLNPINTAGANMLLQPFLTTNSKKYTKLEQLIMKSVPIDQDFIDQLAEINADKLVLSCTTDRLISSEEVGPSVEESVFHDPVGILFDYVKKQNLRLMDLFAQFDKDNTWTVTRKEFADGIRGANIPLSDRQLNDLLNTIDKDASGEIEFGELLLAQQDYRMRQRKLQRFRDAYDNTGEDETYVGSMRKQNKSNYVMKMSGSLGGGNVVSGGGSEEKRKPELQNNVGDVRDWISKILNTSS